MKTTKYNIQNTGPMDTSLKYERTFFYLYLIIPVVCSIRINLRFHESKTANEIIENCERIMKQ